MRSSQALESVRGSNASLHRMRTPKRAVEEEVRPLSNRRIRCYVLRACAVVQVFHVLYVVSGGGHRHQSKTEVSYNMQCVL